MPTLLLRSQGIVQSCGDNRGQSLRSTGLYPTKSQWLGLLCNVAGIDWSDDAKLSILSQCWFGVRIDRQGTLVNDYCVARSVPFSNPSKSGYKETEPSHVLYLCDASFLVGVELDDANLIDQLYESVLNPVRIPFLGRKSCPPGLPISQPGPPVSASLREALLGSPWLARPWEYKEASRNGVMVMMSTDYVKSVRQAMDLSGKKYLRVVRQDNPVSFDHGRRRHESRVVLLTEEHLAKEVVKKEPWIGREAKENETVADETEPVFRAGEEGLNKPAGTA